MNIKARSTQLDAVRITACFLVCSVHFFLNSGYYSVPLKTSEMAFFTVLRSGCMVCVPLFLLLTGYLMNGKKPSLKYYTGLDKTLFTYVLAGAACMLVKRFVGGQSVHFKDFFSFTAAPYGWYVEMYIGLFLLIPFINLIWHGLSEKKHKQLLVLTLIVLTALPSVLNIFVFDKPFWWSNPTSSNAYVKIIPSWWAGIYPVTYYFTGAYLKEFPLKLKKAPMLALIFAVTASYGLFCFYRSAPGIFQWGDWQGWGTLPIYINSVLVFSFIASFNMNGIPLLIRKILALVSDLCFGAYLLSWIADFIFYPGLISAQPNTGKRMIYFFCFPLLIFSTSLAMSAVIHLAEKLVHKVIPVKKP